MLICIQYCCTGVARSYERGNIVGDLTTDAVGILLAFHFRVGSELLLATTEFILNEEVLLEPRFDGSYPT